MSRECRAGTKKINKWRTGRALADSTLCLLHATPVRLVVPTLPAMPLSLSASQRGAVPGGRGQQPVHGWARLWGAHRARHATQERVPAAGAGAAGRHRHPPAAAARPAGAGLGQQQCSGRRRGVVGGSTASPRRGQQRQRRGSARESSQVGSGAVARCRSRVPRQPAQRASATAAAVLSPVPACCSLSERAPSSQSPLPPAGVASGRRSTGADSHRSWSRADSDPGGVGQRHAAPAQPPSRPAAGRMLPEDGNVHRLTTLVRPNHNTAAACHSACLPVCLPACRHRARGLRGGARAAL